ncbi:MAG: hypothetical protein ILA13_03635 [Eubacterium sp.]|nr:hypothetical protein [Eubacterium sp.]
MSKKTKILIAVLIVLAISGNIAIIKHRIDVENRKQEEYIDRINHTMYLQALGLCKDEEIYSGDMKDKRVRFNENELMMRAAYYNGVLGNTGKDVITTDDLKRYYQEYIDGDSTNIVNFCNVIRGVEDDCSYNENYDGNSIDTFESHVNGYLTYIYGEGTISDNATPEQMDAAIKKTMSEYETGKYRDAVDSPLEKNDMKKEFQELIDSSPELDDNH